MTIPFPIRRNLTVKISDFDLCGNIDGMADKLKTPICYVDVTEFVQDISFQTYMPGGFGGATITMTGDASYDVGVLRPGSRVIVSDRGRIIYEGRIEDPGVTFTGTKANISVLCAGHVARLKDDAGFRRVFVDSGVGNWVFDDQMEHDHYDGQDNRDTDYEGFSLSPIQSDDGTTANDKILMEAIKNRDYDTGNSIRAYYYSTGGRNNLSNLHIVTEKIHRITFDYSLWLGDNFHFQVYTRPQPRRHKGSPDEVLWETSNVGSQESPATGSKDLSLNQNKTSRCVIFRMVTDATGTGGAAHNYRAKISDIKIYGTSIETPKPHSIVGNIVSELFANYIYDATGDADLTLDHFAYTQYTDRATIIEELNAAVGWDWGVWDNETFYYLDPEGLGRKTGDNLYVASLSDPNIKWDVRLDYSDVVTEVIARRVRHKKLRGDIIEEFVYPTTTDDTDIDTEWDPDTFDITWGEEAPEGRGALGFIRRKVLDLTMGGGEIRFGKKLAKRVAKKYVELHNKPVWAGTIEVTGPIQTAAGTWVAPWWIRAGQYIECTDMGYEYERRMKILSVDVSLATGVARLEVGRPDTTRIDRFLAMVQMRNKPKSGWRWIWERV